MTTAQPPAPAPTGASLGAMKLVTAILPWIIIGLLFWAGFAWKLQPTGETVQPPPLEKRDKFYGIATPAPGVIWLAGNYGKVIRSDDDGATWTRQNVPLQVNLQDIGAWDADRAVAVGNGGRVMRTTDGGRTWTAVTAPTSTVANKLLRVRVRPDGSAWAVGEYGMIIYSADFGATWAERREPQDVVLSDIAFAGANDVWVVGEFGRMIHSTDGGKHWTDAPKQVESSLTGIVFRDPQNGVAVGLEGVILVTADGGATWKRVARTLADTDTGGASSLAESVRRNLLTEHLLGLEWIEESKSWFAVGNKGVWALAAEDAGTWQTGLVGVRDLAWHTGIGHIGVKIYISGQNAGEFSPGSYRTFRERG